MPVRLDIIGGFCKWWIWPNEFIHGHKRFQNVKIKTQVGSHSVMYSRV